MIKYTEEQLEQQARRFIYLLYHGRLVVLHEVKYRLEHGLPYGFFLGMDCINMLHIDGAAVSLKEKDREMVRGVRVTEADIDEHGVEFVDDALKETASIVERIEAEGWGEDE